MGALMKSVLLAFLAIVLALGLILFPEEAFQASLKGLDTWWRVVFPSLLPFFIISELLIGFGVVHFLGILLEPLMRPLFRVPGIGGFVWAMGMASGNPAGPKLAARMREERAVSRMEAERLAAFTSSANPLFIFGAVAVGFFLQSPPGRAARRRPLRSEYCRRPDHEVLRDVGKGGKKRAAPSPPKIRSGSFMRKGSRTEGPSAGSWGMRSFNRCKPC